MGLTSLGGGGSDLPDWVVPVVLLAFVLSPVALGLALRQWDRWRDRRKGVRRDQQQARAER